MPLRVFPYFDSVFFHDLTPQISIRDSVKLGEYEREFDSRGSGTNSTVTADTVAVLASALARFGTNLAPWVALRYDILQNVVNRRAANASRKRAATSTRQDGGLPFRFSRQALHPATDKWREDRGECPCRWSRDGSGRNDDPWDSKRQPDAEVPDG